jgi:hypothetical protein
MSAIKRQRLTVPAILTWAAVGGVSLAVSAACVDSNSSSATTPPACTPGDASADGAGEGGVSCPDADDEPDVDFV